MNDVDVGWVDKRVGVQHVGAHAIADGDDGIGTGVGGALNPRRNAVPAAELLLLPGAKWFKGVGGQNMGYAVQQGARVPGKIGVPGVRVQQVQPSGGRGHFEVDPEHPKRRISRDECGGHLVGGGIGAIGPKTMDLDINQRPQVRH